MPKQPASLRYRFESRPGWITAPLVLSVSLARTPLEAGDLTHLGPGWEEIVDSVTARAQLAREIVAAVPGAIAEGRHNALALSGVDTVRAAARIAFAARLEEALARFGRGDLVRVFDWGLEPARAEAHLHHRGDRVAVAATLRPTALELMRPYLDGRRRVRSDAALLAFIVGTAGIHAFDAAAGPFATTASGRSYFVRGHEADEAERQLRELERAGWIDALVRKPGNPHGSVEFTYTPSEAFATFRTDEAIRI